MQSRWFAYILLAAAQLSIAVNVVVGKSLIDNHMPTFVFLGARFLISSICLTILMLFKPGIISNQHPTGKLQALDWGFMAAQAFAGGFLFNYLFYWGIEYTTATSAGIISSSLPAILAIFAFYFLGEKLHYQKLIAILFAVLGIMVISLDNDPMKNRGDAFGDFLILLAMFPEALYSIFSKFMGYRLTSLGSATIINWMIFLMILPFSLPFMADMSLFSFSLFSWGLVGVGGLSGAMFYWAWPKGLLVISASTASIFTALLPLGTALLSWYFLREPFTEYDAVGMILVLLSIAVGTGWLPRLKQR